MSHALLRWTAATLAAALLAACGGGDSDLRHATAAPGHNRAAAVADDDGHAAQAAAGALAAHASGTRRHALVASSAQAAAASNVDPEASARQLMDFAEVTLPAYFPGHAETIAMPPLAVRHYPATGVYLGVVVGDGPYPMGSVYVLGGAFGDQIVPAGHLADYIVPVTPGYRVEPAADKVAVVQGSTTQLRVAVPRLGGYAGTINLALDGLPPGVSAQPVAVTAGAAHVDFTLAAGADAAHSLPTAVRLTATAPFDGRLVYVNRALTVTLRGSPGVVDTSFNGSGTQITPVANSEDYAHAVAVQADGKVVTVGTTAISSGTVVALTRHLRDGGLDPSFGNGGKVITQVGLRGDSARAVAVQPDGKIVVAGWTDDTGTDADVLVLRYRTDGTLDPAFANAGRFVLPIGAGGGTDRAYAVAIQSDGKIVVGGTTLTATSTTGQDFAVLRLTTSGTLDASFGQGGTVITPMNSQSGGDIVYALALPVIDGEQRIVAVGGEGEFIAARYTAAGVLDGSFGNGGKVVGLFGRNIGAARAVVLLPGGRMLLAGGIYNDFAAAQLTQAGTPDPGFGNGGTVIVPVSASNWDNATAAVRQADGKLLLGGWAFAGNGSAADFVAVRLLPGGALDTFFGNQGITIRSVAAGTRNDSARGMVLQQDDRVPAARAVLGGEASTSNNDFALLRLWL